MKKITPQMKIVIIAALGVTAFLIFWAFMYLPSQRKIKGLKSEFGIVKNQINQIEDILSVDGRMEKGIRMLQLRYDLINSKFPQKEEEALGMLSDIAKQFNTEIYSITSRPKEYVLDEDRKRLEVEGKYCQKILISMKIKASYKDLIEYIDALNEKLPAYITIESLIIQKDTSGSIKLNIDLNLDLYLLA